MATTLTSATFSNTYKDDFLDSDGYHRILFNSGKTLQARELTQMQTILQKQIERFGNNIFKEGAVVKPGGVNLNQKYEFIKLNTSTNSLPSNTAALVGTSFTGQTSGVVAKIIEVVEASGSDPATLYVQYTSTSASIASTATPIRMQAGENIDNGSTTLTVQTTNTVANRAVGTGSRFSIASGIYYTQGHFVFTENQSKIISKYSDAPNVDVGFKVLEEVVTTADDIGLYDNQGASPNLSAPGADRYRIRLLIATRDDIDSDENFVHVATIQKGVIYASNPDTDAYDIPNKVTAQRIFENSGNYIVKPFTVKFDTDSSASHLQLQVSDGVAVVEGYRAERYFSTNIRIDKALSTLTKNNEVVAANFGNYLIVNPTANTKGLPNINTFEKMNLRSSVDYGGSTIGTARIRGVTEDGSNYRYHLFDIKMNSGQAFRNVKSVGTSSSNYFNPVLESSKAVLKEPSINNLLFTLPSIRPQTISDISYAAQRRFLTTTNASGEASISLSATGETFTNTGDWIFANADSDVFEGSVSVTGAGTASATISGLPASSSNMEILGYVNKASATIRTKTLTSESITTTIDSDGNGVVFVPLKKADIFDLTEVINASDSSQSYENRFSLDNGQRDNFYALGRLVLKGGSSAPSGNIHVKYRYFTHGTSGDFFAVNSYTGQVTYNQIPNHTLNNGTIIALRDALDFRSVQDSDEAYSNSATGARIHELPQPTDLIQFDASYYLPRAGKLVIDTEGSLKFVEGTDGFVPIIPEAPDQTLGLYNIYLGGNTLNDSDVIMQKIEHKRYTMSDISKLEKRVDKLEELTSLSMLEIDTKNFEVLDSAGVNRTKAGFFVDNFSTQVLSDTKSASYSASIDPLRQQLRPVFFEDNIKLLYDSASSTNTIKKGDNIYIKYDENTYINQTLASNSVQINPFAVVIHEGIVTLSPASDEWRDTERVAAKTVDGGQRLDTTQAYMWDNWSWNWGGIPLESLQVGSTTNAQTTSNSSQIITNVNKVVSDEIVEELIADRVINVAVIPFIRSRKIYFKAQGLRPNSKVFAFFDGVNVANWVRSESFAYYSDDTSDYGNLYKNITEHPDGSTTLETDANGEVSGTFFIPNTGSVRFRSGTKQFKILDISVDNEDDALSIARAPYSAKGWLDTYQKEYLSTRVLTVEGVKNVQNKKIYYNNGGGGDGGNMVTGGGTIINDYTHVGGGKFSSNLSDAYKDAINDFPEKDYGAGDGGSSGCFLAGTLVTMADGTKKSIETIELGENVALGGFVFAKGSFLVEDLYDYKGIKVSGSHMVYEQGRWTRVKDSFHGIPEHDETVVVYNFGTENRRLLIEDVTFTDYFEISEKEKLETLGDKYFDNWRELSQLSDKENERVLNN